MKIIALLFVLLICSVGLSSATTWYIATDGSGDYNCDGIEDNIQIQAAINNASANDIIFIKSGDYNLSTTLLINQSDITLRGNTSDLTVLEQSGACNVINITYWNTTGNTIAPNPYTWDVFSRNVSISNMTFIGSESLSMNCIRVHESIDFSMSDMNIYNTTSVGIMIRSSYNLSILNSNFLGHSKDIQSHALYIAFNRGESSIIDGNIIDLGTGHGIELTAGHNITVSNNTISNFGISGVYMYTANMDCTYHNNTLRNSKWGIHHIAGGNWAITDNKIYNNTQSGIASAGQFYTASISEFSGNQIYNNGGDGWLFSYNADLQNNQTYNVTNCVFYNNDGDGISNDHHNVIINVTNSIITNNTQYGLHSIRGDVNSNYNNLYNNSNNYINVSQGTNDIFTNSYFYDLLNYNFHLNSTIGTWNGTGWEIMSQDSPCIDAGNPTDDYSNEPSPSGDIINIGIYGNTATASKSSWVVGNNIYVGWICDTYQNSSVKHHGNVPQTATSLNGIFNMVII